MRSDANEASSIIPSIKFTSALRSVSAMRAGSSFSLSAVSALISSLGAPEFAAFRRNDAVRSLFASSISASANRGSSGASWPLRGLQPSFGAQNDALGCRVAEQDRAESKISDQRPQQIQLRRVSRCTRMAARFAIMADLNSVAMPMAFSNSVPVLARAILADIAAKADARCRSQAVP